MERTLTYQITEHEEDMEILAFLRARGFSRHILASMKGEETAIQINGGRGFGHTRLSAGDFLRVHIPEENSSQGIRPVKMELKLLYEDEDILVINKDADTPIHPSVGNYENTLANGTAAYFAAKGERFVFRCINRLDRDTTGALILAKNPLSGAILSQQMKRREIRRTYLAITEGIPPASGTISVPISRAEGSAILRRADFINGERAVTHFERLATHGNYALLELHLETGRTHQIRVHMKYLGCPLPGDYLYNPSYSIIRRQPLHSYQLEFRHPITGKELLFTAPLPSDFVHAFQ